MMMSIIKLKYMGLSLSFLNECYTTIATNCSFYVTKTIFLGGIFENIFFGLSILDNIFCVNMCVTWCVKDWTHAHDNFWCSERYGWIGLRSSCWSSDFSRGWILIDIPWFNEEIIMWRPLDNLDYEWR